MKKHKNNRKSATSRGSGATTESASPVEGAQRVTIDSPPVNLEDVPSVSLESTNPVLGRIVKWLCPIHLVVAGAGLLALKFLKDDPSIQNMTFCAVIVYAEVLLAKMTAGKGR